MKKLIIIIAAMTLLLGITTAFASSATKVGVINLTTILQKNSNAQAVIKKLNTSLKVKNKQLQERADLLRTDINSFQNASVVRAAYRTKLQKRIRIEANDLRTDKLTFQRAFLIKRNKAMAGILNKVKAASAKVAKKMRLDLVVSNANVTYAANSIDVTKQVLKALS